MGYNVEKIDLKTRIWDMFHFKLNPSWERIFIVASGIILNILICYLLGLERHIQVFIIASLFIQMFMVVELPQRQLIHSIGVFSLVVALAFFTAAIGSAYYPLAILFFIMWFLIFTLIQLSEFNISKMGLYAVFIYFFAYVRITVVHFNFTDVLITSLLYGLAGILLVVVGAIPTLLINFMEKDPYKKKLLSEMFTRKITYNQMLEHQSIIASSDNSERTKSLINVAIKLYISNNNLENVQEGKINDNVALILGKLDKEVDRLLKKVEHSILRGYDEGFELNVGYIIGFQKNIKYQLEKVEYKTSEQMFLLETVSQYAKLFIQLNQVLNNDRIVSDIDLHNMDKSYIENIKENTSKYNVKLRYSVRFMIAGTLGFISDVLIGGTTLYDTTMTSGFTLAPDHKSTGQIVVLRIVSTLLSIIASLIIVLILEEIHLTFIILALTVVSFLLYFVFEEDYAIAMFFLIMGIIFLEPVHEIMETSMNQLLSTVLAMIIVLFSNYFILPSNSKYNIYNILLNKMKLTQKHIETTLMDVGFDNIKDMELYAINNKFDSAMDKIESVYIVEDDINLFKDLSDTLTNLRSSILLLSMESGFSHEILINTLNDFFDNMIGVIDKENIVSDVSHDFKILQDQIKELESSKNCSKVLSLKYKHILSDLMYINDLIIKAKASKIFDKYNQKL